MKDSFFLYRRSIDRLIQFLSDDEKMFLEASNFRNRLLDNINKTERYGDNENCRAERYEILNHLDGLCVRTLQKPFRDICIPEPICIATADNKGVTQFWQDVLEPEMHLIQNGHFIMGSPEMLDINTRPDEYPMHIVNLPTFFISTTPITNIQYAAYVIDAGVSHPTHWPNYQPPELLYDHPVVNISWYEAMNFCDWLTELKGYLYRLPSEAEWEKSARGIHGNLYPWGNQWNKAFANTRESTKQTTVPVKEYAEKQSFYGLIQMTGNVNEWTSSLWGYSGSEAQFRYPYTPDSGCEDCNQPHDILRVIRGGSFNTYHHDARCAARLREFPDRRRPDIGFRVVCIT